jgi:hypothetical protein
MRTGGVMKKVYFHFGPTGSEIVFNNGPFEVASSYLLHCRRSVIADTLNPKTRVFG